MERIFHLYNKKYHLCFQKNEKQARHCATLHDIARRTQTRKTALGEQAKTCVKHEAAKTAGKQNDIFVTKLIIN